MYVLDTDVSSDLMKRAFPALIERVSGFAPGELKVSVVTVYELEYGARRSPRREDLLRVIHAFLDNVEILPFDLTAARHASSIRAALATAGTMIGSYDLLIAGHTRSMEATLVTHNVREFSRVEGLEIEDWVES